MSKLSELAIEHLNVELQGQIYRFVQAREAAIKQCEKDLHTSILDTLKKYCPPENWDALLNAALEIARQPVDSSNPPWVQK